MIESGAQRAWTVAEAKGRLSEILRLSETEGPQIIGLRRPFVVVPAATWYEKAWPRRPLGKWLMDNVPRGLNVEFPRDRHSTREIPFNEQDLD